MGQLLTWIRGPRDGQALQDVSVEQQVCACVCACVCVCVRADTKVSTCVLFLGLQSDTRVIVLLLVLVQFGLSGLLGETHREEETAWLNSKSDLSLSLCWNVRLSLSPCDFTSRVCVFAVRY